MRLPNDSSPQTTNIDIIKKHLTEPLEAEWETGKGSIGIVNGSRMMVIFRSRNHGFVVLIQHGRRAHPIGNALRQEPPETGKETMIQPWGCDMTFPCSLFVDGWTALRAAEHFIATGSEHPELRWVPGGEFETGDASDT
ncbi:MAG: hypothetical protein ACOY3Y_09555 [Acidobacteriota bacterium]